MKTMVDKYGATYTKYAGQIWVSAGVGFNVALLKETGELKVLGFGNGEAEKVVIQVLKTNGWSDHYIAYLLSEKDEVATCAVCGQTYHENQVNLVDYEEDVCMLCEPKYKENGVDN
ncbi:hypothetical protein [Paenibacillus medicaginis]|uniref:Uncharacterized protein n=1 Tax=Paenibacillus medicaginis TaxID=1470560 RepID=A0ABV5C0N3_9BACL